MLAGPTRTSKDGFQLLLFPNPDSRQEARLNSVMTEWAAVWSVKLCTDQVPCLVSNRCCDVHDLILADISAGSSRADLPAGRALTTRCAESKASRLHIQDARQQI